MHITLLGQTYSQERYCVILVLGRLIHTNSRVTLGSLDQEHRHMVIGTVADSPYTKY